MIPVVECSTAADVVALARRLRPLPPAPIARGIKRIAPPKKVVSVREYWLSRQECPVEIHEIYEVRMAFILRCAAEWFEVSALDIVSSRRQSRVCHARQVAMWVCRTITRRSLPEIGKAFGGRDHTTVLHSVKKVERRKEASQDFAAEANRFLAFIQAEARRQ